MKYYEKIIVALELNQDEDLQLIKRAQELSDPEHGKIYLVHAVEPLNSYGTGYAFPMIDNAEMDISTEHRTEIIAETKKLGIPTDNLIIQIGAPNKVIIAQANQLQADLIIVGSHTRHGLAFFMSNNSAELVLHKAPCDMLAVHLPR